MGMDVLIMQEMRNAAAFAYLRALASGHLGLLWSSTRQDTTSPMTKRAPCSRH